MSELKSLLDMGYSMQFATSGLEFGAPGIIPAQYSQIVINATAAQVSLVSEILDRCILQQFEIALHDLLWRPHRFIIDLLLSTWTIITTSPPLIRLAIFYFVFRYTIYRLIVWAKSDYQTYLDLGRGGSSPDIWGWWRVTRLKFTANVNVLEPPHVPPLMEPYRGILWQLPSRSGPRPKVQGIAPQRQMNQKTPISTFERLSDMLAEFAQSHPQDLHVNRSFLEGYTSALKVNCRQTTRITTSAPTVNADPSTGIPDTEGEYGYEICHPHRQDGSLHLVLHPEDIRTTIEAGWGERHPLATNAWYWRLWYHGIRRIRTPVPEYLVFVYAPRNEVELDVVYRLVRAAVWFGTKKVLDVGRTAGSNGGGGGGGDLCGHRIVAKSSTA